MEKLMKEHGEFFSSGKTFDVEYRLKALTSLYNTIKEYEPEILRAIYDDIGKAYEESFMCEVGLTLNEISYIKRHLKRWAAPKRVPTALGNFPSVSRIYQEPYGHVLVMSPWNYPFMLCMEPLAGAIAAGNTVVLKPSNYSPATSAIIKAIVDKAFEPGHVSVVMGGREENQALLEQKFDYIFFTGGVTVGKEVMRKAAEHLTPVTLELGGKSPVIVDRTANIKVAAKRTAYGKILNCGQTCIAPDYLLIDAEIKDQFVAEFKAVVNKMFGGGSAIDCEDYGKIVNEKHFNRICGLMDESKITFGGGTDPERRKIEPTVMEGVTADDAIMHEEIFGPVLPIITYRNIREAEDFVRSRPKPLALYLFTGDKAVENRFTKYVSFGGGCINDTIGHLVSDHMAFGGVGNSGMGGYHGRKSFETFSHAKGVLKKSLLIDTPMRYQPYSSLNDKLIRLILR